MVDAWKDSTEYELTVKVKTGVGPKRNVADVTSAEVEEVGELTNSQSEDETEPEAVTEEPYSKADAKPMDKPAITVK